MQVKILVAVALVALMATSLWPPFSTGPAEAAGGSTQSTVSIFLNCPGGISFSLPSAQGSCGAGNYTAVYSGIAEALVLNKTSRFYISSAVAGGLKVTFSLTDVTSGKLLFNGVGYGSTTGGTCTSPGVVKPTSFTLSSNTVNSGDTLRVSLKLDFSVPGTSPTFCSGGAAATLVSVGTTLVPGTDQVVLDTTLASGKARQASLSGYQGISETYVNTGSTSVTALVIGVVSKASAGTTAVLSTSISVAPGVNVTAFLTLGQYPSGTYTVTLFAISGSNVPISTAVSVTVTV